MDLTVQTLDVINDMLHEITGYGSDRKVNFSVNIFKTEDEIIEVDLTYKDTGKFIFKGIFNERNLIEAIKNEAIKEKEVESSE